MSTREDRTVYQRKYMREWRERRQKTGTGRIAEPQATSQSKAPRKRGRPPLDDPKMLLQIRLKQSLVGRLNRILHEGIANGTHNWKNLSQLVADMIVHGLEFYARDETVAEALQYLRAISATDAIGAHRKEAQAAFSRVKTELTELLAIRATDQARHYFWATRAAFERMSPNVWRDWFLAELDAAFPKLKAKPTSVPLLDSASKKVVDIPGRHR